MRTLLLTLVLGGLIAACGEKDATDTDVPTNVKKTVDDAVKDVETKVDDAKKEADKAADEAGALVDNAKTMIADALAALKGGDNGKAKGLLEKLDGMKANLPENLQSQIADAWKALKAKEGLGGLLPK